MTGRPDRGRSRARGGGGRPALDRASAPVAISIASGPQALVDRARTFLASGPSAPVPLIEHVCQLPGAPAAVAEQMALALLSDVHDVARDDEGRWGLVREGIPTSYGGAATVNRPLRSVEFAVVDVETTGSTPATGGRITEIGVTLVCGGEVVDSFETLVNPQRPIPAAVTALTRITWNMVREAPTFREVSPRVVAALDGNVFVAHNATFDWRFVSSELADAGRRMTGERLCTVKLARAVLPRVRRRSLDALSFHFGIDNHARHRAGGDSLATARVLLRLLEAAEEAGCRCLEDVRELMRRVPAGRRRGRQRRALPGWSDGEIPA